MKYCSKCGNEMLDEAVICTKCGCMVGERFNIVDNKIVKKKPVEKKDSKQIDDAIKPSPFGFVSLLFGIISMFLSILSVAVALGDSYIYTYTINYTDRTTFYFRVYFYEGMTVPALMLAASALILGLISFKDKEHPFVIVTKVVLAICALVLSIVLLSL